MARPVNAEKVAQAIEDMVTTGDVLDVVAARRGMSRSSLAKYFRIEKGTSVTNYRRQCRREKYKIVISYKKAHPFAKTGEIAKALNITASFVCEALKGVSLPGALDGIDLMNLIKSRPVASFDWYKKESGRGDKTVQRAITRLELEGWFLDLEREILIDEFFETHPNAKNKDAAVFFGVPTMLIINIRNGERNREYGAQFDRDWHKKCVKPPADIQKSIDARGGLGVSLPRDHMKRYINLFRRKQDNREAAYNARF